MPVWLWKRPLPITGACARRRPSEARRTALARECGGLVTSVTDPDVTESVTCRGPLGMGLGCRANSVGLLSLRPASDLGTPTYGAPITTTNEDERRQGGGRRESWNVTEKTCLTTSPKLLRKN
jgi:hypothetical protein